ncbi:MAG: hypothetical protein ABEJ69_01275 [Candidatus Nanohaloarchaea archaeon]
MEFDTFKQVYPEAVEEVERETGLSVEEAFDEFDQRDFSAETRGNTLESTRARTFLDDGVVSLEYMGDLTARELAHETVHGEMLQAGDLGERLPGDDLFDMKLYGEFAANLAEVEVDDPGPDFGGIMALISTRSAYKEAREDAAGQGLTSGGLFQEYLEAREKGMQQFREAILEYQDVRENVVAQQAAREYARENDYDLENYLEPDEQLFHDTVDYVKNFEQELLDRAKPDAA